MTALRPFKKCFDKEIVKAIKSNDLEYLKALIKRFKSQRKAIHMILSTQLKFHTKKGCNSETLDWVESWLSASKVRFKKR